MLECLALVASVCINQSAKVELVRSVSWSGASIEFSDGKIVTQQASDAESYISKKETTRDCSGACFWYSQRCGSTGTLVKCIVYFTQELDRPVRQVTIEAETVEKVEAIKKLASICFESRCVRIGDLAAQPKGQFPPLIYRSR